MLARAPPKRAGKGATGDPAMVLASAGYAAASPPRSGRAKPECPRGIELASNVEAIDQLLIARLVLRLQIIQKAAARGDELQQSAARMVVLDVRLEMFGQAVDPFGEDRDLHFRRTGIVFLDRVFFDERLLALRAQRHRLSFLFEFGCGQAGMSSSGVAVIVCAGLQPVSRTRGI